MKLQIQSKGLYFDADEGTVVYFDPHSGDTHLLSDFAAFILQQFDNGSLTRDELMGEISRTVEPSDTYSLTQSVAGILDELISLDILTRA